MLWQTQIVLAGMEPRSKSLADSGVFASVVAGRWRKRYLIARKIRKTAEVQLSHSTEFLN
jgi:hypothetical protein